MRIDLNGCARCDADGHPDLEFAPLTHPVTLPDGTALTHWAPCPTNGEPILMLVSDEFVPPLGLLLARLYRSEINAAVISEWDAGWDVRIGGGVYDGWKATTWVECPTDDPTRIRTVDEVARGLQEVADWLHARALELYPDSEYAREATS